MTIASTLAIASVVATGCVAGGGPYVAYGQRGWSTGVEAGVGFAVVEANLGLDVRSDRTSAYIRGDVAPLANFDPPDQLQPTSAAPGQRSGSALDGRSPRPVACS